MFYCFRISSCERELPFFCEILPGPIRPFPPADPNLVPENLDWNKCLNDPIWEHYNYTQTSERLGSQTKETKSGTWNFLVEIHRTQSWLNIETLSTFFPSLKKILPINTASMFEM